MAARPGFTTVALYRANTAPSSLWNGAARHASGVQHAVPQAEERGVGADAKRERENRDGGEAGCAAMVRSA